MPKMIITCSERKTHQTWSVIGNQCKETVEFHTPSIARTLRGQYCPNVSTRWDTWFRRTYIDLDNCHNFLSNGRNAQGFRTDLHTHSLFAPASGSDGRAFCVVWYSYSIPMTVPTTTPAMPAPAMATPFDSHSTVFSAVEEYASPAAVSAAPALAELRTRGAALLAFEAPCLAAKAAREAAKPNLPIMEREVVGSVLRLDARP